MTEGRSIPFFGDGSSERDYTFIDDILDGVEGALRFVTTGDPAFEIVNLGESRTVSLARMVDLLGEKLGVTPELQRLPPSRATSAAPSPTCPRPGGCWGTSRPPALRLGSMGSSTGSCSRIPRATRRPRSVHS